MSRFPSAGHLVSWAGPCPRSDESAGKRRATRVRKSGTWIKTTLVTAAWAAVRVKTSYLRAQFLRIKARRGAKKAILAVAASMLAAAFHMLRDGTEYNGRFAVFSAQPAFMVQASCLRRRYPDRDAGSLFMTQYLCLRCRTVDHEQRRGVHDESV